MSLTAWLHYIESFPSGLHNRSLVKIKSIARKLRLLNFPQKIIIVGGTNGKSSSVVLLESILRAAGYNTGAYISPHLLRYNERIRLNGIAIDDKTLCRTFAQIEKARGGVALSYFEFSTLVALAIFKRKKVEILILEVGLGGRFDAVNILDADIAIITTISLEHTHILGSTREAIGYEKSGIMRPLKPVICGDTTVPKSVSVVAKKIKAILYCVNQDFCYRQHQGKWCWQSSNSTISNLPLPQLPLANAATVLMAIKLLQHDLKISKKAITTGLNRAFLPGRWQTILLDNKQIIFDVAHNPESAALLARNIAKVKAEGRILAVMSMLGDKDIAATLRELTKVVDKWYIGLLTGARAANARKLTKGLMQAGGGEFVLLPNIAEALKQAIAEYRGKDKIVVFGSFHTVAAGLKNINIKWG